MLQLQNLIRNMRQFKVMIVDDESPSRRALRMMMKTLGFSIFRDAEDGNSALRKLKAERFDLVICSWDLPLMNGKQLLRFVRDNEISPKAPFIFIIKEPSFTTPHINDFKCGFLGLPLLPQTLEDKIIEILFRNLTPSDLDIHFQEAGAALAKRDFEQAHIELDHAEKIGANKPFINYFRWLVYNSEGRTTEAEEAIEKARKSFSAIVLGPREADAKVIEGKNFLHGGQLDEAKLAFEQALELDPDNQDRLPEIGQFYLDVGLIEEAEEYYARSIKSNPDDIHLYNMLGMVYRKRKKYSEAIVNYKKAITLDPHEEYLYYNLARAYLAAGKRRQAANELKRALEQAPDFKEARELLTRILKLIKK